MKFLYLIPLLFSFLSAEITILALSGSTRKDSANKKLIAQATSIAEKFGAKVTLIDLNNFPIPFYDGDLEANQGIPENAKRIIQLIKDNDGIMIASPCYNGSISAVLKNIIDWSSRFFNEDGKGIFAGKSFAIMSASPSPYGGSRGLKHLEDILTCLNGKVVNTKVSVGDAYQAFDSNGKLKNTQIESQLTKEIQELISLSL